MMSGRLISFEGIDGAGKSSHIEPLSDLLRARGIAVVTTREPGGTPVGEAVRDIVTRQPMSIGCEALLMFAAREELCKTVIQPALVRGDWVIADRFTDATFAYQGAGRGLATQRIQTLADWVHASLWPDLTLFFDVPPRVAADRVAANRGHKDKFEQEDLAFFERVRNGYLHRAANEPGRFVIIDGTQAMTDVFASVTVAVQKLLDGR